MFESTEGEKMYKPFDEFYTTNMSQSQFTQKVEFPYKVNCFESRGSHFSYYPTDSIVERRLERKIWEHQNRIVQEKRQKEETYQLINEWSRARSRVESDIQRKKEHLNNASNFEAARGFVRTNFKSKGYDPMQDPTQDASSTDTECERDQPSNRHEVCELKSSPLYKKQSTLQKSDNDYRNQVIDMTKIEEFPAARPSVDDQLNTLHAIQQYNKTLPKRRKAKDSLAECETNNISASLSVHRDVKKKTFTLSSRYNQVGIVDPCEPTEFSKNPFSIANKQVKIQRSASHLKVQKIRKFYDNLIRKSPKSASQMDLKIVEQDSQETDLV